METISTVRNFVDSKGKDKVVINSKFFLSPKQIESATGIKAQFGVLVGSDIDVTFYKTGDDISEDMKCTKDNMIIKDFTIVLSARLQAYKDAAAFGVVMTVNAA